MTEFALDTARFGKEGPEVTICGLGGEGVLRTYGREAEAREVIQEALARGITYFDCARAYAGSESYYGLVWRRSPELRKKIFQAGKSASRSKSGALRDLETTFKNMGLDYLDLWQLHDVRTKEDIRAIEGPGGALEAFADAKKKGMARYIGVTGHHDPKILSHAVKNWPVDSVMLPVNPAEAVLGGFLTGTLAEAKKRGIAVIGMKLFGMGRFLHHESGLTPERLLRFALSQEITVAIVGCSTPGHVKSLADAGRGFEPMPDGEQRELKEMFRRHAARLAFYRGVV